MAFSTTSFHFPRSWTQVIQFLTFVWQMSCLTLSSHRYLSLPCDLSVGGFHLNIFLTVLVSGIICTWPNQLSLWALIPLTIFLCFISLSNSSLVYEICLRHCYFSSSKIYESVFFFGPEFCSKINAYLTARNQYFLLSSFVLLSQALIKKNVTTSLV